MSSQPEAIEPDNIGPYRVIRPIARGGMASVYEVEDEQSHERCALKLLTQPGLAIPRFNREYRALQRLNHPNIVRVYRFGLTDDGQPYLTMELLDGVAAQVYAKSCGRPGTPKRTLEVIRIVSSVALALEYLHERGIVHRDLKSSNVLVQRDGTVKLLDFGTARVLESMDQITRHGEFIGTFAYASPEQLTGRKVDGQADLYSLGVLFYRLLTGKRPFEAQSLHELAKMHLEKPPRPPNELAPGIPDQVTQLVLKMLAKSPDDRPDGAKAVVAALEAWSKASATEDATTGLSAARMVGRDEELTLLREAMAVPHGGMAVLISGEPGSGRARILQQMSTEAREKGWRVYEATFPGPPGLGALGEIARIISRSLPRQERPSESVDRLDDTETDGNFSAVRSQIFGQIADTFIQRAALDRRPMGLFLHNLERAPPLAVDAMQAILERSRTATHPVVVFASVTEDADLPGKPFRVKFRDAARVTLPPLGRGQVGALIASMLGFKSAPPDLAQRAYDATGGLPGYVEEVIRAMVRSGLIEGRRAPGNQVEWVDQSKGRIAIPASARESVSRQLDSLPHASMRYLEVLAVAGGVAGTTAVAFGADVPPAQARTHLRDLAYLGVLRGGTDREDETWKFRLGLTAALVTERLKDSRREVLERRLAEALWDEPTTKHKLRLVEAAGFVDKAIEDAIEWAHERLALGKGHDVLEIVTRLVSRVAEVRDLPPTTVARLFLEHGRALTAVDAHDAHADQSFARAAALSTDPRLRAEVDVFTAQMNRSRGKLVLARDGLDRAASRLRSAPDVSLQAMVALHLGEASLALGDYRDATRRFEQAQKGAESEHELPTEASARVGLGRVFTATGLLTKAEAQLIRASEAFARIHDEPGRWMAATEMAALYRQRAQFSDALTAIESNMGDARRSGQLSRYVEMLVQLIDTEVDMYRLGEAREHLAEVLALGVAWDDPSISAGVARVQARLLLAAGEAESAIDVLNTAVETAVQCELKMMAPLLRAHLGQAAALCGDRKLGDELTAESIEILKASGSVAGLAEACVCRSVVMAKHEDPDVTFGPVLPWVQKEPARLVHMAFLLSAAEFALGAAAQSKATLLFDEARELRDRIGQTLSPTDRNGLEVHPWTTRILRGLPNS